MAKHGRKSRHHKGRGKHSAEKLMARVHKRKSSRKSKRKK